ncbi:peptidoglycan-N-acetylglucosamine deacetylase [Nematocida sp. LUAm3]|nr:peptidoglycan-N-acetylglucosamine deacetylase [Nematocida sp. LUAm3]KAI5173571.1 peptidoglycan-N-acetylglucosamine deacetylase [Nematocida sp. LUAm2]KAI5176792.1 peptidoglycan-N-acetylglucosamine deacetylase [Nematocida sp. LUAm1]
MRISWIIGICLVGYAHTMRAPCTCEKKGQIAMVFSDGPVQGTPNVLETLEDEQVQATFMFSTVNIDHTGVIDVIRKAIEDGHTVGLRTNPIYNFSEMSEEEVKEAISMEVDVMSEVTGEKIRYITINQPDMNDQVTLQIIDEMELILVNYNYDVYGTDDESDEMISRWKLKLKSLRPQSISYIILQHDQREVELCLVPELIGMARNAGFKFVNMDECLEGASMEGSGGSGDGEGGAIVVNREKKKSGAFAVITWMACLAGMLVL